MADKTLADVPVELAFEAQQVALMRLQLYTIGKTHELLGEFGAAARGRLMAAAGSDGKLDGLGLHLTLEGIGKDWANAFAQWQRLFEGMRREAAALPFGTLAVMHRGWIGSAKAERRTSRRTSPPSPLPSKGRGRRLSEADALPVVFEPQLQAVLDAANARLYGDGLTLSGRIWRLDQASLDGIRQQLYAGVASQNSAWNMAQQLEAYLGFGAGCPRWTSQRLHGLTKSDIAGGDETGLLTGDDCDGRGVAHNALRLARNEIQVVHHMATDAIMAKMPWVEKEEIHLSPSHPETDICDSVVGGGENGTGVYPVGSVMLPLHVQCVTPGQLVDTQRGSVPIEQVRVGDLVLTHEGRYRPVWATWERHVSETVYALWTSGGFVELTGNHPVRLGCDRGWTPAQGVRVGDEVVYRAMGCLPVGAVLHRHYEGTVYNLSVVNDSSYTVNGACVHNCLCYKSAVLADPDAFAAKLKAWMQGDDAWKMYMRGEEGAWPEMDAYAGFIGAPGRDVASVNLAIGLPEKMVTWLWGDQAAMDAAADAYQLGSSGQIPLFPSNA